MTPERIEQERKAFEWWISNPAPPVPIDPCQKQKDGRYAYDHIEFAWRAWQARAAQSGWISVEDRLPEVNGRYLGFNNNTGRAGAVEFYKPYNWKGIFHNHHILDVTHWQPLPEPPAQGDK